MWLRLILGVVYVGMAVGQLASWTHMPEILAAYQAGEPAAMRGLFSSWWPGSWPADCGS